MTESVLTFVRELERADEEVAAVLTELDALAREAERVRERALAVTAFLAALPAERERTGVALEAAERELDAFDATLASAHEELAKAERAGDRERVLEARRREVRARDARRMAERRREEIRAERARLDQEAEEVAGETPMLERRTRELAAALRDRPRLAEQAGADPRPGLDGVAEWGSRARAALFVARGGLAAEREALVRQANELGALVLGEPLSSASPAVVARRVERERGL